MKVSLKVSIKLDFHRKLLWCIDHFTRSGKVFIRVSETFTVSSRCLEFVNGFGLIETYSVTTNHVQMVCPEKNTHSLRQSK